MMIQQSFKRNQYYTFDLALQRSSPLDQAVKQFSELEVVDKKDGNSLKITYLLQKITSMAERGWQQSRAAKSAKYVVEFFNAAQALLDALKETNGFNNYKDEISEACRALEGVPKAVFMLLNLECELGSIPLFLEKMKDVDHKRDWLNWDCEKIKSFLEKTEGMLSALKKYPDYLRYDNTHYFDDKMFLDSQKAFKNIKHEISLLITVSDGLAQKSSGEESIWSKIKKLCVGVLVLQGSQTLPCGAAKETEGGQQQNFQNSLLPPNNANQITHRGTLLLPPDGVTHQGGWTKSINSAMSFPLFEALGFQREMTLEACQEVLSIIRTLEERHGREKVIQRLQRAYKLHMDAPLGVTRLLNSKTTHPGVILAFYGLLDISGSVNSNFIKEYVINLAPQRKALFISLTKKVS